MLQQKIAFLEKPVFETLVHSRWVHIWQFKELVASNAVDTSEITGGGLLRS